MREIVKDGDEYRDVRLYNSLDREYTSKVTASVISKDKA